MFRSHFKHTLDNKGRVSLPAEYRVELQANDAMAPIITKGDDCLCLYPQAYWVGYERRIIDAASIDPDGEALLRLVVAGSHPCPVDRAGRILIPQPLREHAKLEREAMIAGVGPRIELWDKARFDADLLKTQARYLEISSAMAKLGT